MTRLRMIVGEAWRSITASMTNLGASLGTALAGSVMIAMLTTAFISNIQASEAIPNRVKSEASTNLASGVPFISDDDLEAALDEAKVSSKTTDAAITAYQDARIDGLKSALAILALITVLALFTARRIPTVPVGSTGPPAESTA